MSGEGQVGSSGNGEQGYAMGWPAHGQEWPPSARHHLQQSSAVGAYGGQAGKTHVDISGDSSVQVSLGVAHGVSLLHAPPRGQGHHGGMAGWTPEM